MDAQARVETSDIPQEAKTKIPAETPVTEAVDDGRFEAIVAEALDGVGGTLLFSMLVESGPDSQYVAAGSIGEGEARDFLILSMPAAGGELRVEPAANSDNPIAGIAASYAGLADAFATAA